MTKTQKPYPACQRNRAPRVSNGKPDALSNTNRPLGAQIIRLPIFRDGVFIMNEFVRIGPGLRARIREMARESGR